VGVGNCSLKVDDADRGYTGGPKNRDWEAVLNHKPIKVLRRSTSNPIASASLTNRQAESASETGCWLRTVRSEESLCS